MSPVRTPEEIVQDFAVYADGWSFDTDEDATRHDLALIKLDVMISNELNTGWEEIP